MCAAVLTFLGLSPATYAETSRPVDTIPVSQIHTGMRGVAYTVFQGTKPEAMEVEVLGVLKNANGPKGDVILVRLSGAKVNYTGVVAGMSGSPVYFNGKLAGAVAFRIGEFSKEPIAGVTPISEMLEISAIDNTPASVPVPAKSVPSFAAKTSGPGLVSAASRDFANYLKPIETPLVFSGFTQDAVEKFAPQFASAGIVPVMGVGSRTDEKQPDPLVPGSAVSAVLVSGDMNIAATCTATYVDSGHLLACGHPLLQSGMVDLPMTKAEVLATLPSPLNAFKIVNATETVGAFVQDRHTGILGQFGKQPEMIPVTLTIHGGTAPKVFHYQVLNNARLSPVAISTTVYNALHGVNEYGDETTYAMKGDIRVDGFPEVKLADMFSSPDGAQPAAMLAASSIGDCFGRIFDNPYNTPDIKGLELDFEVTNERRWARLESAHTGSSEARPGEEVNVEVLLQPYRGEAVIEHVPVRIPASASKGSTLHIMVSDGEMLDRLRHGPSGGQKLDLASTIGVLNKQHQNNRVYVSVLDQDPEAVVADKVMPALPFSVMNVMGASEGAQDMTVVEESAVSETSTAPLNFVVSGGELLSITIK